MLLCYYGLPVSVGTVQYLLLFFGITFVHLTRLKRVNECYYDTRRERHPTEPILFSRLMLLT